MRISSLCPYCGCACRLIYEVENGRIIRILPEQGDRVSEGKPCIKGLTVHEVADRGRLKKPVIRKERSEKEVSWKEALEHVYAHLKDLSPEEAAFYGSGKITNEDNWAVLKFAKIAMQTNNTDSCCGRLCHIATVEAMLDCFGNSNLTKMEYVNDIDVLLIIGSNPAVSYPAFFNKLLKRRREIKIISVQPLHNLTSKFGDMFLYIEPGTEVVLLNALANYLIRKGKYEPEVEKYSNFNELKEAAKRYTPELVEKICRTPKKDFLRAAKIIGNANTLGIFHGMGLTQHVNAIENVHSLLNIAILKGGKILSLRGEVNVQGVGDIGFLPDRLPTGGFETVSELEKLWHHRLPVEKGKTIMESLLVNPVRAAFICAFNPAQSLPALKKVHKNLENMFLVYCDSYRSLTAKFADVILPTPALFERKGTITNGERRVRVVFPVRKPFGESMPEWKIIAKLSKLFGKGRFFSWKNELEIFREIVRVVPAYRKLNAEKIYSGRDMFADKSVKYVRFMPERFEGKDEMRSRAFPFLLTTFRSKYQFLTGEMTGRSRTLTKHDEGPCVYVNPQDASSLSIREGETVRIVSEEGWVKARVRISEIVPKSVIATRFHYEKLLVNKIFPAKFDEATHTPNYKCVAVRVEKVK